MRIDLLDGKHRVYEHRKEASKLGFWYVRNNEMNGWTKDCKESEVPRIKKFCKKYKLEYAIYENGYTRSTNYRNNYFKTHKGLFGKLYQCAYCGRLHTRKNITIDHIIPVDKVIKGKERDRYKRILNRKGITDVNDIRNLVPACRSCNSRKSANTGLWIIRGRLGSHPEFWVLYYIFFIVVIIFIICNYTEILYFLKDLFFRWIS